MTEAEFLDRMVEKGYSKTGHGEYAADMSNDVHTHDFAFSALVLEGEFRLTTEEGAQTLGPGDSWSLDAGTPHAEEVVGAAPVKFVYGVA